MRTRCKQFITFHNVSYSISTFTAEVFSFITALLEMYCRCCVWKL